jgi:ankyrin repeat protein
LYRGLGGLVDLPDAYHDADEFGRSGFLEWGMMSTSSDMDVALGYSGVNKRRPKAMVMMIEATSVNRGADISEFSQYPEEKEFLWLPCSFVQRAHQRSRGRVQVVDGALVTFVPVRVNLNLKTETVDELMEKKKSLHLTAFEFRVNELRQQLHDQARAGDADTRLKRDKDRDGLYWKKSYSIDSFIQSQVAKVEAVLQKHRDRSVFDYSDDAVFRSLVAESLDATCMAHSTVLWWLKDETVRLHLVQDDFSLLWCQREYEAYLQLRCKYATHEGSTSAAVELCKTRNLFCVNINERNSNHETPLLASVGSSGSLDDVLWLISARSDLAAVNSLGESALMLAAQRGRSDVIDALLRAGAHCNQVDKDGRTALYIAARNDYPCCIEILISARADVNLARANGTTPLFSASCNGRTACVRALLLSNADTSLKWEGWTPLDTAIYNNHHEVVRLLEEVSSPSTKKSKRGEDGEDPHLH